MNAFKLSRWIPKADRHGRTRAELSKASRNIGHRAHQYWSRSR